MEEKATESRKYLEDTTYELIQKYKNVIEKTFEITDKDLLQDEIDNEDENQKETRLLDALKKRRVSLDEVDIILEKIDKLEKRLIPAGEEENGIDGQKKSWAKKIAEAQKV